MEFQNKILQKTILTQDDERKRIARDLHDDISSKLTAVALNLHLLKSEKTPQEDKQEIIDNTFAINDKAIESSRKIAHHLFPPVLEKFGLLEALEEPFFDYNKTEAVKINFTSQIEFNFKVSNSQLQIFRIIQELINNYIKHGKATEIQIKFRVGNTKNEYFYIDNGLGFDNSQLDISKGLGFSNIENRIQNINGTFKLESQVGSGFQFNFTF